MRDPLGDSGLDPEDDDGFEGEEDDGGQQFNFNVGAFVDSQLEPDEGGEEQGDEEEDEDQEEEEDEEDEEEDEEMEDVEWVSTAKTRAWSPPLTRSNESRSSLSLPAPAPNCSWVSRAILCNR